MPNSPTLADPENPTLVRHIYDLHVLRHHYDSAAVISLARTIMLADVEAYGHQFPAYRADPVGETLRAVGRMAEDPGFSERYSAFLRDMVYGETAPFSTSLSTITALAQYLETAPSNIG